MIAPRIEAAKRYEEIQIELVKLDGQMAKLKVERDGIMDNG